MRIKYDADLMKTMTLFESLTHAKLKDAILNESLMFVVMPNEVGKAVGKNGSNVRRMEGLLKKKIRIVEFSSEITDFVKNLVYPLHLKSISFSDGVLSLDCNDTKSRGILIGRDRKNINFITSVIRRYFDVEEVKVG